MICAIWFCILAVTLIDSSTFVQSKDKPETYGPDLTYNGYRLKDGKWEYVDNMDMRNVPNEQDENYIDPKLPTKPIKAEPVKKKAVQ